MWMNRGWLVDSVLVVPAFRSLEPNLKAIVSTKSVRKQGSYAPMELFSSLPRFSTNLEAPSGAGTKGLYFKKGKMGLRFLVS
jgi:hypothetical protein